MEASSQPKLGLALSGGGFRAAFFHLGVLARMAELGMLRRVEVISTVSGGSIVGAAYYMRLKWLLERRLDSEITDDDYCALVADVAERLRAMVRKNVRGTIFLNPFKNLAMASRRYSRSDRIGDLYDLHLYNPAWEGERSRTRWGAKSQIELRELLITPAGEAPGFKPDTDNGGRAAKVPILLLNATALNSGHDWRFEAVRMGEPLPDNRDVLRVVEDADKNIRLEQGYFEPREGRPRIPAQHRDFPLALAVAASACVPGLFHPLAISYLYDGITVQLVDGGVQDNQGVQGLFDEECTHLVISDASLQLPDETKPSGRVPGVLGRSMSIQSDRIRDEEILHVAARGRPYGLMHLRKGLTGKRLAPGQPQSEAIAEREGTVHCSQFGVDPAVQKALGRLRTDLDFFNDTEAFSLAADGYLMSAHSLRDRGLEPLCEGPEPAVDPQRWWFSAVAESLAKPDTQYLGVLRAGRRSFFRLASYTLASSRILRVAVLLGLLALVALAVIERESLFGWLDDDQPVWTAIAAFAVPALILVAYLATGTRGAARVPIDWLVGAVIPILLAPFLFLWAVLLFALRPLSARIGRVP
ncbi:MAG: hypothetical protein QOI10_3072 [Solirubrobacterales bacterium]|jgi:NTE family protein|nr:hypothetical protein [Solirubrobacterales bacterium]